MRPSTTSRRWISLSPSIPSSVRKPSTIGSPSYSATVHHGFVPNPSFGITMCACSKNVFALSNETISTPPTSSPETFSAQSAFIAIMSCSVSARMNRSTTSRGGTSKPADGFRPSSRPRARLRADFTAPTVVCKHGSRLLERQLEHLPHEDRRSFLRVEDLEYRRGRRTSVDRVARRLRRLRLLERQRFLLPR